MNSTYLTSARALGRRQFIRTTAAPLAALAMPGWSGLACAAPASPWRMRLAFSSVMLAELPIEEVCTRAAKLGFEAIDIWCPFDRCKHLSDVVARLGPEGLKQLLAKHKLTLASFTTYTTEAEAVGFPAYADFIGKCGGGLVVRESQYIRVKPEELTAAMRAFFEKLKPQIEQAAQAKVRLAIENHGDALLSTPDSFKAFVDLNPAPQHVGLGVAPYHLQNIRASVEEVLRTAGSQLLFFYAWQTGDGMNQLPGHGPADFVPWLKALAHLNYQGFLSPFMHGRPTPDELTAGLVKACAYLKDCHTRAID
ncbi:MAG: TIM barrel protein [Verrucomicrobia bacterium]|nr:TIM barrel protein [Verrucomicrobiota bacterium]